MKNFKALLLAADFYRAAKQLKLPTELKKQLTRAASSACLNLSEGRGRGTRDDQVRHFHIAMGSIRECQSVLIIEDLTETEAWLKLDRTAATVYRLIQRA